MDGFCYSTDKYLNNRILVSSQVYNKPEWLEKVIKLVDFIEVCEKALRLKPVEVRFASLKEKLAEGFSFEGGRHIEIDIKLDVPIIKEAIAHEMIHCQQFQTGKVKFSMKYGVYWKGEIYKPPEHLRGMAAYRAEPHEKEAFANDRKLVKFVDNIIKTGKLGKPYKIVKAK